MDLDPTRIRDRFPALARTAGGRRCVFADAPGGTQVPEEVIEAMAGYLARSNANSGGAFATSRETDEVIGSARRAAADLLGSHPSEVVFGPNMTTLTMQLSRSLARGLGPGDEIVVTVLDHDANISPWVLAARDTGATVRWVDVDDSDCTLDRGSFRDALGARTRVVALTLASNAVGSVTPATDLVADVRERAPAAVIVADAVHLAPHRSIDVRTLGADVLLCSPYKFFGPHLGVMVARTALLEDLEPYRVRPAPDAVPDRWETGTQSHEALAGLTAAVAYLRSLGEGEGRTGIVSALQAIAVHEARLSARFLRGVAEIPGLTLYGIADPDRTGERTPTFALRLEGRTPRAVAEELDRRGIFAWDGNYYALAIMERLGLEASGGAVRIGFCHYHDRDDVDRVLGELATLAGGS